MEIKCSVQELKELYKNFQLKEEKKTPVARTTDVIKIDVKNLSSDVVKKLNQLKNL